MHPLDLAILRGRLTHITDEMDIVQARAAFSPVVSEMWDRSNAIIDARTGEVVSQGQTGLPIFVSTMQASAQACLRRLGSELREGDVVILNDPYLGGTHLQDVKMLAPLFLEGKLELLLINTGHLVDIGGAFGGGFDPGATDIFQEGLQIPPTWLMRNGRLRHDVMRLVLQNTRLPSPQEGDLRAQLNALDVGAARLRQLVAERGTALLRQAVEELSVRSEGQMRGYLSLIPAGRYTFVDYVETGADEDLRIDLTLDVRDGGVVVDFGGSSPSHEGPMNLSRHTTITAVLSAFKHLFPEVPINGGCFRPFEFHFPAQCFLDTRPPHAVGGYVEGAIRVMESVFGALAAVLPNNVTAASFGTGGTLTLVGDRRGGDYFATVFPMCGGYGGSRESDGLMHGPSAIGLARFPPLEAAEHDYPIRWEEMSIRPGSGGRGRRRGGPGTLMRITALEEMTASFLGDRSKRGPFGVLGGGDGAPMLLEISNGRHRSGTIGSRVRAVPLHPGDSVTIGSPGGGGYGDPSLRDEVASAVDLADGLVLPDDEPPVAPSPA